MFKVGDKYRRKSDGSLFTVANVSPACQVLYPADSKEEPGILISHETLKTEFIKVSEGKGDE